MDPTSQPSVDVSVLRERGMELALTWGPRVLAAVAIFVIGWLISKMITAIIRRMMGRAKVEASVVGFVSHLVYFLLMAMVVISALTKLDVPSTQFVAVVGAAGLAVAFALQGSLSNFAAGVILILFRPFKVGDYVEVAGVAGVVDALEVFATTLHTPDNKRVVVPNAAITGGNVINYTANETRRVDMVFGISYADDIDKAKGIVAEVLKADARVLADPAPMIAVAELADSSVNLVVRPWVKTADYWDVRFAVTEMVKKAFDAQDVTIPFPQRDVHMQQQVG